MKIVSHKNRDEYCLFMNEEELKEFLKALHQARRNSISRSSKQNMAQMAEEVQVHLFQQASRPVGNGRRKVRFIGEEDGEETRFLAHEEPGPDSRYQ